MYTLQSEKFADVLGRYSSQMQALVSLLSAQAHFPASLLEDESHLSYAKAMLDQPTAIQPPDR